MEPQESSGDSKTPETKSKRKHGTRSSSTTPDRMDAMENKIEDLTNQLRQLTTALTSLTTSPSLATSSPTPSSPSSPAFGRTLAITPMSPLAAGRSAQQPVTTKSQTGGSLHIGHRNACNVYRTTSWAGVRRVRISRLKLPR